MRAVSDGAKAAKSAGGASGAGAAAGDMDFDKMDEMFKSMLATMGGAPGDGANPAGLDAMMADMMSKMFSKDVLKDPIKAIAGKYPDWIAANREKHSADEFANYERQFGCFTRLCAALDKPGDDTAEVLELMQEVRLVDCTRADAM